MIFKLLPMAAGVLEGYFRHAHDLQKCQAAPPKEIRCLEMFSVLCGGV
jgi:hypothetical protein